MKRLITVLVMICMVIGLAACSGGGSGGSSDADNSSDAAATEQSDAAQSDEEQSDAEQGDAEQSDGDATNKSSSGGKTLVVYFSATGTTKGVAEKIASVTGADTYEIKAADEYTDEDLDWSDSNSRSTREQNDASARPKIGSDPVNLDGYTTIYIGYPIWWGEEPRIMDTFVESHDFDGITMIPFCTSGGSGIGRSGQNLADNAGSGKWLDGDRLESGILEDDLRSWIDKIQK